MRERNYESLRVENEEHRLNRLENSHRNLFIGALVMMRRNISITEDLVNDVMGIVSKFKWPALRHGELPDTVFIKFDNSTIGTNVKDNEGLVAIAPVSITYQNLKNKIDKEIKSRARTIIDESDTTSNEDTDINEIQYADTDDDYTSFDDKITKGSIELSISPIVNEVN
ncbi:unnamed protein product [Parnassius apollo]|uniref:(apollo) hypothetical protein n=1 Tax=Parnassius apollo TaxID=110799 RepID=A0A8S3W9P4_PARAO|nr:unnamed protein product [Parnassius apollo]